jgi:hypothetical protein
VTKSRQEFYQIGFFHKSSTGGSHRSASDEEKHSRSFLDRERGTSGPYVRIWKEEGQHSVFEHLPRSTTFRSWIESEKGRKRRQRDGRSVRARLS